MLFIHYELSDYCFHKNTITGIRQESLANAMVCARQLWTSKTDFDMK